MSPGGGRSRKRGVSTGSAQSRSDGIGTVGTDEAAGAGVTAVGGAGRGRGAPGGVLAHLADGRGAPPGPTPWSTARGALPAAAAVRRRVRVEMRSQDGIMVPHFAYAFQCHVVGEYAEFGSPVVTSEKFESPNDATGLQIKRSSMPLRVEHSSADICDGFHGTVRLPLFEGGTKPVDASVTVHVKRT